MVAGFLLLFAIAGIVILVHRSREKARAADGPDLACGPVFVRGGLVHHGPTWFPVAGACASVETSGELHKRITMTRMALIGPFALAAPKKYDTRMIYLTVQSPEGFMIQAPFIPTVEYQARNFVVAFNNMSAMASLQAGGGPSQITG